MEKRGGFKDSIAGKRVEIARPKHTLNAAPRNSTTTQSINKQAHAFSQKNRGGRSPGEAQLCKHKSLTAADSSGDISDHADRAWEHMPFLQTREISDKGRLGLAWHGLARLGPNKWNDLQHRQGSVIPRYAQRGREEDIKATD